MKSEIFNHIPLYRFLKLCNEEDIKSNKKILDCGAGGSEPPLSLFKTYNYLTFGIEIDKKQIEKAKEFENLNEQVLNIEFGDMTKLKFENETFDFVYSYNSIFHMKKVEIEKAIQEMKRVLKPNGLMFVNFLSVDDFRCGEGPHLGKNQYQQMDDEPVIHSYFDYDEAQKYFEEMTFVIKEKRIIERVYEGNRIKQGFIDYIVRK